MFTFLGLFDEYRIDYDPEENRLRCHGHILNLVGDSFLFKTQEDALAEHNNDYSSSQALTELEFAQWRKKGAVGKAHNHAVRFSRSPLKNGYWLQVGGKTLPRDNGTRWTSMYKLVSVLDDPDVQKALSKLYSRHPDAIDPRDRLTMEDFAELHKIRFFLQAMYDAILFTEGHSATLDRVLPAMEFVLDHFESGKEQYKNDRFLSPCINSGWSKLNQFYGLTDKSPA